jgi:hypothetical protein
MHVKKISVLLNIYKIIALFKERIVFKVIPKKHKCLGIKFSNFVALLGTHMTRSYACGKHVA